MVIAGPLLGLILDQALYRHLRTAPAIAKLVTSLGLLVAIPQIVKLWFGTSPAYNPPGLIQSDRTFFSGQLVLDMNEIVTIVATVIVVIALDHPVPVHEPRLQMRAVVESPRMTELNGVNADRVGAVAWMLSSLLAGLAGVLLAPLFAQVSELHFFTLLVAALAAAAFGRLSSIPLTLLGGLLLGVLQQLLAGYLAADSVLAAGPAPVAAVRRAVPAAVVLARAAQAAARSAIRWPASIRPAGAGGRHPHPRPHDHDACVGRHVRRA